MLKLIHADMYKTFHRAYFCVLMLSVSVLCVVLAFAMRGGDYGNWSGAVITGAGLLSYPIFLLPMITQIVYAEDFRDHTLKNSIAFGTNRTTLYVSKWLTTIVLGIFMTVVVLAFYFGGAAVLQSGARPGVFPPSCGILLGLYCRHIDVRVFHSAF